MEWVALVILAALVEYFVLGFLVGRYRTPDKVPPPAMTGPPEFERTLRAQVNTTERLVLFIPALWLFGLYLSPVWAAGLGAVWVVARAFYAAGYIRAPERRVPGIVVSATVEAVLVIGASVGVIRDLM